MATTKLCGSIRSTLTVYSRVAMVDIKSLTIEVKRGT